MKVWLSGNRSGCDYEKSRQHQRWVEVDTMSSHIDEAQDWDIVLDQVPSDGRIREPDTLEVEIELAGILVNVVGDIGNI